MSQALCVAQSQTESKRFGIARSMGARLKTCAKVATVGAVGLMSNAAMALSAADQTKVTDALAAHEILIIAVISGLLGAVIAITGYYLLKKLLGN